MPMNRHHDSQRSDRLVTQPLRPTPPQHNSLYHKQLTAPAERLVRALAHAVGMRAATLRPRCSGRRPVTRGRRGLLILRRMTLSFTTPCRSLPTHRRCKMILKEPHARAA